MFPNFFYVRGARWSFHTAKTHLRNRLRPRMGITEDLAGSRASLRLDIGPPGSSCATSRPRRRSAGRNRRVSRVRSVSPSATRRASALSLAMRARVVVRCDAVNAGTKIFRCLPGTALTQEHYSFFDGVPPSPNPSAPSNLEPPLFYGGGISFFA